MGRIAIIAEEDLAGFFRVAGLRHSYGVKTAREAEETLWRLMENEEISVIAVTEGVARNIMPAIEEAAKRLTPTVITIPGREGPLPEMAAPIMKLVKRTVGMEIKL
ncbi:MAG: hypothetical protein DRO52_04910 [Candidatus Hecatellales archaeon]|nr:MAG: hypothetical protein DRO52_04910 [Candidatus Hecatellales archaeon]